MDAVQEYLSPSQASADILFSHPCSEKKQDQIPTPALEPAGPQQRPEKDPSNLHLAIRVGLESQATSQMLSNKEPGTKGLLPGCAAF